MKIIALLTFLLWICARGDAFYDVKLPKETMCSLSGGRLCRTDFYVVSNGGGITLRPRSLRAFLMSVPDIPENVKGIRFMWRRATKQQVKYSVKMATSNAHAMMPPSFHVTPLNGSLPSNWKSVQLTFHCTGNEAAAVEFSLRACFNMTCFAGTMRKRCALEQSGCTIQCLNGGKCLSKYKKEKCVCPEGFTGRRCEIKRFGSCSIPCSPAGTLACKRSRCVCKSGFKGALCQNKIRKMKVKSCTRPCTNGGLCDMMVGVCRCIDGFTGHFCQKKIPRPEPNVTVLPAHSRVALNAPVKLKCFASNIPQPAKFSWYFVEERFSHYPITRQDRRYRLSRDGSKLKIRRTAISDVGHYICRVTNSAYGIDKNSATFVELLHDESSGSGRPGGDGIEVDMED